MLFVESCLKHHFHLIRIFSLHDSTTQNYLLHLVGQLIILCYRIDKILKTIREEIAGRLYYLRLSD